VDISGRLIPPCGGALVDLLAAPERAPELRARASALPSIRISERAACDLELLATGAFSPLERFMRRDDHERVLEEMRLAGGHLFPVPVILPVEPGDPVRLDRALALRDPRNDLLGVLTVEEVFEWDRRGEIRGFTGVDDPYERPQAPEVHLDAAARPAGENAAAVLRLLEERGFVRGEEGPR
jgi:sulfate adenylyltransferase